jgi:hypothetical protein
MHWLSESLSVAKFGHDMRLEAVDFEEVPFPDLPTPLYDFQIKTTGQVVNSSGDDVTDEVTSNLKE